MARRGGNELVTISWRDIPAQVNCRSGDEKHQVILPRRFQKAIDRAAMVADKKTANEYVAEWRRTTAPLATGSVVADAAQTEADRLEASFPLERLDQYVATGGWNPDRPEHERI